SNPTTKSFKDLGNTGRNLLGRNAWKASSPGLTDTDGSMDEVRVWKVARTAEQIRENLSKPLTGREPGLVGLWNFDDPANPGRDASPNGLHGKLIGPTQTLPQALPVFVRGTITDASGRPLTNAFVEVQLQTGDASKFMADEHGNYCFVLQPTATCDFFVSDGERHAVRVGFKPSGQPQERLDWVLTEKGATTRQKPEFTNQNPGQKTISNPAQPD